MRVRHPDADDAFAVEQQFDQRKGIDAGLGQRAVFVKICSFGDEIGPRELAELRGDGLGVLLGCHCWVWSVTNWRSFAIATTGATGEKAGRCSNPAITQATRQ